MILRDIINLLNETIRNAHVVDDERIDPRLFQDYIMLKRNQFIKNHLNEKQYIELNTLQTERLTLTPYDSALDIAGVSIGSKILRTEAVPKMIESRIGPAIYEIYGGDLISYTMQYVPFDRLRWCGNGVLNKHLLFAAFNDDRFYVKSNSEIEKPLKYVNVKAIFADPTLVSTFDVEVDDYPVNDFMIEYMKNAIIKEDLNVILSTKADEVNDANGII